MKANRPASPARWARLCAPLLPLLVLAACVAPTAPPPPELPRPTPRPAPAPVPPAVSRPAPPPRADWRDQAQTAGTWRWRMEGDRSLAEYGVRPGAAVARLTCDPLGQRTILWRNWPAVGGVPLTVTTTGTRRMLTGSTDGAGGTQVSLAPNDALLDAIGFSRGRFMLEMPGAPTLYLPAWPELSRVIEDCRQRLESRPAAAPN